MFIIVAVYAEVLPVRSVRWIVVVIAVFMVHCEQMSVFEVEFSGAFSTNESVNLQ